MSSNDEGPAAGGRVKGTAPDHIKSDKSENDDIAANMNDNGVPGTTGTGTDDHPDPADEATLADTPPDETPVDDPPADEAPRDEAAPEDETPPDDPPLGETVRDGTPIVDDDTTGTDAPRDEVTDPSEKPLPDQAPDLDEGTGLGSDSGTTRDFEPVDALEAPVLNGQEAATETTGTGEAAEPAADPATEPATEAEAAPQTAPAPLDDPAPAPSEPLSPAPAEPAPAGGSDATSVGSGGAERPAEDRTATVASPIAASPDAPPGKKGRRGKKGAGNGAGSAPGKGGGGGKKPPKKKRSRPVRYARRTLFAVLAFLGFAVAAFGVAYLLTPVPSPQQQAIAQGPTFYYADGKTVIAKTGTNRDAVPIKQIPEGVRDAVIAAENRSFYEDPGVSVRGTGRAFWSTVTGEQLQGGSTITQQMVRNYYGGIGKERSVTRKLKEIMVSLKVGREKSKDWILEQYLNTIFFGRDAYGVQAAAKAYYGKDVSQLTPAQGAFLAAAIQQPSNFAEPEGQNRVYAEQRWRAVVNNMVRDGAVTQADAAAMTFPMPVKQKITNILKGQKGYMVNVAKKELIERRGYSEDEINRSGLKITTTFDKRLMDAARRAVTANAPAGMSKKIRTGMVSVDPATGQVLAFYGGRDYLVEALSSSFGDWAQAGSGFKPIVLATALDDGMKLYDSVDGSSPQYFAGTPVRNDSGRSFGYVNLVGATQNSVNTAYIHIGQKVGLDKVTAMAEKMGIPRSQLTANGANTAPTFPLGVISVHPVQQAGVYATFASEGQHRTPFVVKSVTDNKEHTRTFTEKGERVFSQQVARDATYAMQQVVRGGTGTGAQLADGRDVAGKTGTTDAGRAIWFNGFIPQMATTVSMFRSDSRPLNIPGYGTYGGALPAQVWRTFMADAVSIMNYSPKSFGSPSVTPGGGYSGQPSDRPGGPPATGPGPSRPPGSEGPGREPSTPPTDDGPELPLPPEPGDPGDPGGGGGDPGDPGDPGGGGGGTDPGRLRG
ncbi:transglycosylase domain-containing protein [Actinomadura rugatobispora]|uniref:Transglycosylase domain-containing protein n=1 Tax=Actinomadura rugatobispora TaxID=1994 RepID=A0ABW1ACD9_9ACTN